MFFMTSRSYKGFADSPKKHQCNACGRVVVAGRMGLSRHLARSRQCAKDYKGELNPHRQQVMFHSMQTCSTVCQVDDGHQLEAEFMHTISGSLTVNDLLALPCSEYASEDIPNKDYAEEDNFPISHDDDAYDVRVSSETLCALADEESPPSLSFEETMRWASRSCLQGYSFRDVPIMSRKGVIDKLKVRVDVKSLQPLVKQLYLPYSKCFVKVEEYFSAHPFYVRFISVVH